MIVYLMNRSQGRLLDWVRQPKVVLLDEVSLVHPKLMLVLLCLLARYNPSAHLAKAGDCHQLMAVVDRRYNRHIVMNNGVFFVFELPIINTMFRYHQLHDHVRGDVEFYRRLCAFGQGCMTAEDKAYWRHSDFVFDAVAWQDVPYTLLTTQREPAMP